MPFLNNNKIIDNFNSPYFIFTVILTKNQSTKGITIHPTKVLIGVTEKNPVINPRPIAINIK